MFCVFLSFSIGTCFPLIEPFYWLSLNHLQVAAYIEPPLEDDFKLSEVKMELCFQWSVGPFCHGHYYPVTSVQLLVSLTAEYDGENEESLVGLRQLHHPSTSMAASRVTNAGKLWHYRKSIHKALQPWKPLRKHHMPSIWERPHMLQYLWRLL